MKRIYSNGDKCDRVKVPFLELLEDSKRVCLAAPYFTLADPLLDAANNGKKVRLLIELNVITCPKALDKIVGVDNIEIRYLMKKKFHAKIYISNKFALLGSANLTCNGLTGNREAVIKLCREGDSDAFRDLYKLFNDLWISGTKFDKEQLVKFDNEHKKIELLKASLHEARMNFERTFDPGVPPVDPNEKGKKGSNAKSPKANEIDTKAEFDIARELVFGKVANVAYGKREFREPPRQCVEKLNLYYKSVHFYKLYYNIFFLPKSWADAMHEVREIWPDCLGSGFFKQPLMMDFRFDVKKNEVRLFGQLITNPGDDRDRIVSCIKDAAKQFTPNEWIEFGPDCNSESTKSAFFKRNRGTYMLDGKCNSKSLADAMESLLRDFKPAIDAIGNSLR